VIAVLVALSLTDVTQESFAIPTTVGPLPRVMQRLTEVTKTPYRVHGSMVEEVAALGTPSIPLSETMEKLAQITEATWTRDTQGYLLFRTDAQIKASNGSSKPTSVASKPSFKRPAPAWMVWAISPTWTRKPSRPPPTNNPAITM
jgi:hypothetical protein